MKYWEFSEQDIKPLLSSGLIIVLIFLLVFGYLYRNIQMSTVRYEISRLKKQEKTVYLELEDLRLQIATYSTASRLENLFQEKYGYLPVQLGQRITTLKIPEVKRDPDLESTLDD